MIEMERTPSRVEVFFRAENERDRVGDLVRLAGGGFDPESSHDPSADHVLSADVEHLAEELQAEYAALCEAIETAR
jgi:hypothetical protein